jgi:hypothetical protein
MNIHVFAHTNAYTTLTTKTLYIDVYRRRTNLHDPQPFVVQIRVIHVNHAAGRRGESEEYNSYALPCQA